MEETKMEEGINRVQIEKSGENDGFKKCLNCGFVFRQGNLVPMRGVKHPDAYFNPMSPVPQTSYIMEVCPKCGSDAIQEFKPE